MGKKKGKDQQPEEALPAPISEIDFEESYNRLSSAAQCLLLCLAPFREVFFVNLEQNYFSWLQEQPALASLVIDQQTLEEVRSFGLFVPDKSIRRFLRLQPLHQAFLRERLREAAELREAIETAFFGLYIDFCAELYRLLTSQNEKEKRLGMLLTQYELENLRGAVEMALRTQAPMTGLYAALSTYVGGSQEDAAEVVRRREPVAC